MEIALIAEHNSTDPRWGYNHSTGGEKSGSGTHHTDEAKKKISQVNKGKRLSEETRRKVSAARKGWSPSAETRAKIAAAGTGRPSPRRGKTVTAETRDRLRAVANKSPVVNLDTGQTYPSIHEAARQEGAHSGAIWAVCNGKVKTHRGHRWAYAGEVIA
jgi:hypothetical protein